MTDEGAFRRLGTVEQLMRGGIEGGARLGQQRRQSDAPGCVAAGVLEMGELLDDVALAGADGRTMQGVNVIEDAHGHAQPVALRAAQFFHFEPEVVLLHVVRAAENFPEVPRLGGHLLGDMFGGGDGLGGHLLEVQPFGSGLGEAGGNFVEVADFFRDAGEFGSFGDLGGGAEFEHERPGREPRTEGERADHYSIVPGAERAAV